MKVSELAKELQTTSKEVLATLKSLKLKAKDGKQDLSSAAVSLVKSQFKKSQKTTTKSVASSKEETTKKKAVKKAVKKVVKKVAKKAEEKKTASTDGDKKGAPVKKRVVKKIARKKVVKKKTAEASSDTKEEVKVEAKEKPKTKISKEPVFTLKPLQRKRKKTSSKDDTKTPDGKTDVSVAAKTDIPEPVEAKPVEELKRDESLPDIEIKVPITVKDFSTKIQQKPSLVLTKLMKMGVMTHINQSLDADVVQHLTREFGYNLAKIKTQEEQLIETHKQEEDDPKTLKPRAPVITFMGHVDHGKTSLVDRIRKTKIADQEHGGITQHIGAYSVKMDKGAITILDTPGHEAFTAMRSRGAHITDIVVVVVAADEGIMPQTKEAIDHARAADVPIVVALNKIDKPGADLDRVKKQLMEHDLASEDWGGKTVVAPVSAMTGEGIDEMLELILLEAELLELKANPDKKASGIIVEAHMSKGKGAVATLIVQSGTLNDGDFIVAGPFYGKVKAMFDDHGRNAREAGPSMPVEILGLPDVPEAGEAFYVVEDERQAREITFRRREDLKNKKLHASQKITLEDLYSKIQEGSIKELSVIIKADVQGSLEALKDSLAKIPSDKVKLKFIHTGVGDINASDILLANASDAIIIAFHVGTDARAKREVEEHPVDIREYRIIYDAVTDIRKALEGLLEAKIKKNFISRVEIREVFKLSKAGVVAGCYVTKGKVKRKANVDIVRNEDVVYSGVIDSLKRFKDDVKEVTEGMECGITVEGFTDYQSGDIIEVYEIESIAQKL
ncbi:MAG: translation initiation factor IF-2 [Candidatus Omnitrophica bacterium]|nr:translation initiation factor IF-2 [Candidatus Omnitrophota bacterium]